jgi:circadian clock protein KaiC
MSNTVKIRHLATGVPGLDEILGGGLPEFSFNLIAGSPGSGKTTLAHQIMFNLATPEMPALFFSILGEPPLKMLRYQQQFSYFDADKINASAISTWCCRASHARSTPLRRRWSSLIRSTR